MQEIQLKLSLYSNRTELKAEISLPNTDENYDKFIEEKTKWELKDKLNVACIKWVEPTLWVEKKENYTDLEKQYPGFKIWQDNRDLWMI